VLLAAFPLEMPLFYSIHFRRIFMRAVGLRFVLVVMVLAGLLAGCSSGKTSGGAVPGDAALKITGMVDKEVGWTEDEVHAMDTVEAESTNKAGETSTYTGVLITALLDKAGVKSGAATLVFVADDGYTAEVALSEVQACQDCIVSFRSQGGFSTVLPGFPGNTQVKGVIEIQVK